MIITQATLDALRTQFTLGFDAAYQNTEVWHTKLASIIPSSAKSNTYGWIIDQTRMREWLGPRVALNLSEHEYVLTNKPFEATIELDRDDIEDDNLGLFASVTVPQLAEAARKHADELLADMLALNSGDGPVTFDGLQLFDDAHPTYDDAGTTYDNKFALALTADNVETVWETMASYTGQSGRPLLVRPTALIVPPQLYRPALEIMNASWTVKAQTNVAGAENVGAAAIDNVMKGWMEVIMIPELATDPTRWYCADLSKAMKPLIVQNRRPDQFVTRDNPADPKVFDQKKYSYGVDNRRNVGVSLPFLIATSKP